jgi:transposase
MICDLERQQVVDLLPERTAPAVAPWLPAHPGVAIVCRDRRGLYAEGIRQGAPQAIPVVDRCHLVQHRCDALERLFLRDRRDRTTLDSSRHRPAAFMPTPVTISRARHARGAHRDHQSQRWHARRVGMAAIARHVQVSRPIV